MKRTAAAQQNASAGRFSRLTGRRGMWLFAAFLCCGVLMFLAGRSTVDAPRDLVREIRLLKREIYQQQGKIDRLKRDIN